ncbi:hypothetical protein MTP04_23620 [Lysinibacillus sp. PLM2]|nr:hypothetical protein MTP04_23620 [Lysinibacillus sp. PLM2]
MRNHNFYYQMPNRPYPQFRGPSRMPNYGYQQAPRGFRPGMAPPIPPSGTKGAMPKLESFMETANRFLATAQSFQPYIAQATPLFRNLPALWRIYKGFKSAPDAKDEVEDDEYSDESSEFEYEYKESEEAKQVSKRNTNHDDKRSRAQNRKYEEQFIKEESIQKRAAHSFFPVQRERKNPPRTVEKISPPKKTKPSVPKIFQPPFDYDEL